MNKADMCGREAEVEEDMEASSQIVMAVGTVVRMVISPENVPRTQEAIGRHVAVEEEMEVVEIMEEEEEPLGAEDTMLWRQEVKLVEQDSSREQLEVRSREHKPSRIFRQLHPLRGGRWSRGVCEQD